ncbi:MAG: DUF4215 domain-containing protein [Kofleriaceae bacterium]
MTRWSVAGWWIALAVLGAVGCLQPENRECAGGATCALDQACTPDGTACVPPSWVTSCEGKAEGEDCDARDDGHCRAGVCRPERCGDGVVQADLGEACDDGVGNGDAAACTSACAIATCGDGLVQLGVEACDLGGDNADDGPCTEACAANVCGDGRVWAGVEACDDGNLTSGDGCREDCRKAEVCGDAALDLGEACDDGNGNPVDGCDLCARTAWTAEAILAGARLATEVSLVDPAAIAVDGAGDVLIADAGNHRVWRVLVATGQIAALAGTGVDATSGDGGNAVVAALRAPNALAVDGLGNVYIADQVACQIRRVEAATGRIDTVAGTGTCATGGDGGPAIQATLAAPRGLAVDGLGNVFVAELGGDRVRKIDGATGVIVTYAGGGTATPGDDGPANSAVLTDPAGLALDAGGDLYIAEAGAHRVRRVARATGLITTVAGTGTLGFAGDGGPAVAAALRAPLAVTIDAAGRLLIADTGNHRLRRVDAGVIMTLAGGGPGFVEGGDALAVELRNVGGVAVTGTGDVVATLATIPMQSRYRAVVVRAASQTVATLAGTGTNLVISPQAATSASVGNPFDAVSDANGDIPGAHEREPRRQARRCQRDFAPAGLRWHQPTAPAGMGVRRSRPSFS